MSFSWHCKAHSNVHTRFFRSFHVSKFAVPLFHIYPPWYLMQYDWLVPSMRLQVIQDSLFSRLGSGLFSGRGKMESRNRTNGKCEVIFTPTSSGVNILQRLESNCQYYQDDSGSVLKITLLAPLFLASFVLWPDGNNFVGRRIFPYYTKDKI